MKPNPMRPTMIQTHSQARPWAGCTVKFMAKDKASRHSPNMTSREAGKRSARRPTMLMVTASKMPEGSKAAPM